MSHGIKLSYFFNEPLYCRMDAGLSANSFHNHLKDSKINFTKTQQEMFDRLFGKSNNVSCHEEDLSYGQPVEEESYINFNPLCTVSLFISNSLIFTFCVYTSFKNILKYPTHVITFISLTLLWPYRW